jgi:hypothetical protein
MKIRESIHATPSEPLLESLTTTEAPGSRWRKAGAIATAAVALIVPAQSRASEQVSEHRPLPTLGPYNPKRDYDKGRDWAFHNNRFSHIPTVYSDTIEGPNTFWNGNVKIEGFSIRVNSDNIYKNIKKNELVQVAVIDKAADKKHRVKTRSVYSQYDSPKRVQDAVKEIYNFDGPVLGINNPSSKQIMKGIDYVVGGLEAITHQEVVIEKDRVSQSGEVVPEKKKVIPITFQANVNCPGVRESIVSEVSFPEPYRRRACRYLLSLSQLIPNDYTIIFDKVGSQLYENDSEDFDKRFIQFSLPFIKDQKGHSPEQGLMLHEALHATYEKLGPKNKVHKYINRQYKKMIHAMTYRMPSFAEEYYGYPVDMLEPVWAAIAESTYETSVLGYRFSDAGHPWDNPTEMTSSAAAVMCNYPKRFTRLYGSLDHDYQKEAVRAAAKATFALIRHKVGEEHIVDYIPKYEYISQKLGIRK